MGLLALCALAACARPGPPTTGSANTHREAPDDFLARAAQDCLSLLEEYTDSDLGRLSEAELERQMEEALLNEDLCAQALSAAYHGPGGRVMGEHLARALSIHALQVELTLSTRFDDEANYCTILTDLVRALETDLTALDEALEGGPTELGMEDVRTLVPLRDLTIQSLAVSLVDYRETCQ